MKSEVMASQQRRNRKWTLAVKHRCLVVAGFKYHRRHPFTARRSASGRPSGSPMSASPCSFALRGSACVHPFADQQTYSGRARDTTASGGAPFFSVCPKFSRQSVGRSAGFKSEQDSFEWNEANYGHRVKEEIHHKRGQLARSAAAACGSEERRGDRANSDIYSAAEAAAACQKDSAARAGKGGIDR